MDERTPHRDLKTASLTPQRQQPIPARNLFGDLREIVIEHHGVNYRLSITRNEKLILTK